MTEDERDALLLSIKTTVTDLANNFVRQDTNQGILKEQAEARDESDAVFRREVRASLSRLEAAVVEVAKDTHAIRERVNEERERTNERFRLIEANGHG